MHMQRRTQRHTRLHMQQPRPTHQWKRQSRADAKARAHAHAAATRHAPVGAAVQAHAKARAHAHSAATRHAPVEAAVEALQLGGVGAARRREGLVDAHLALRHPVHQLVARLRGVEGREGKGRGHW